MPKKTTNVVAVTIAIFIATFMTAIEGTIVSTALPTIVGELHGVQLMNWIISIYLLTNAMATPVFGKLADRSGRKPVFLIGLAIFVTGSLLSGLSNSMPVLIVMRALQGIGAGAIMPVTFTIIADIYPFEKRAKVLGFNGSAWGIAALVAPLLGGFIVERLSWHWIYFINVPIGLLTMVLVAVYHHEDFHPQKAPIDYFGALWLVLGLLFLLLGFQALAGTHGVWALLGWLAAAGGCLALFWRQEKRAVDPIIDLALFKNHAFVITNVIAALISGFVIGYEAYMPMWVQGILGLGAALGGFAITPSSMLWIVGSFVAGRLLVVTTPKKIMTMALGVLLAGSILLALVPQTTPYWAFLAIACGLGFGFGNVITTTTVRAQAVVAEAVVGVATSFNTLCRTLGQTLMVSVYGVVLNLKMAQGVAAHPGLKLDMLNQLIDPQKAKQLAPAVVTPLRHILYTGLHGIYWCTVVIVGLAIVANWFDRDQKLSDQG
ncbi:MDR family MFS transporter [Lacticaseibacillus baoqingensis]|uniref:MDR family MFS transporter n=1 Tax=Lacticaseibacillus baoqingensis TaxID=2486013 RepID=A0ABW4E9M7_9LACO|nr:MDR family MFS transporter [Lacticaseibacillus baoqingensis]